jgi:regulator of cell morphogenesis and NO signaling
MRYQSILGSCNETTVGELIDRCPETSAVFAEYGLSPSQHSTITIREAAEKTSVEPKVLCQRLFDVYMTHKPLEELDTESLLALIAEEYEASHLEQLPKLHRLARKIEAVHRANPDVPQGITRAVKHLEQVLAEHIQREETYVMARFEHEPAPRPDTPISQMNQEHDDIKKQLRALRGMTRSYQAPQAACRSWRKLYDELKNLDFSLSEQIYLERDILFPRFQF